MKKLREDPPTVNTMSDHLVHQLKAHPKGFHSYTWMNLDTLKYILKRVESV